MIGSKKLTSYEKFISEEWVANLVNKIAKSTTYYDINDNMVTLKTKSNSKLVLLFFNEALNELNILSEKKVSDKEYTESFIHSFLTKKEMYLAKNDKNSYIIQDFKAKGCIDISTDSGYIIDLYNYIKLNNHVNDSAISENLHITSHKITFNDNEVYFADLYGTEIVSKIREWFIDIITKVIKIKIKNELNFFDKLLFNMNLKYKFTLTLVNRNNIISAYEEMEKNTYKAWAPVLEEYEIDEE